MQTGPIPLVLGVTGHRDLRPQDVDALGARVGEVLADFRTRFPHSPLLLLSSLAEGADRLVARKVLETGGRLVVPLPMPPTDYSEDFHDPESKADFSNLLSAAESVFVVESIPGVSGGRTPLNREQRYALAGAYIARNCQVLIALWDGVDLERTGGTSEVVKFRLEGESTHYRVDRSLLDPPEAGPVYRLNTPRLGMTPPEGEPLALVKDYPRTADGQHETPASIYAEIFRLIDQFNADAIHHAETLGPERERSRGCLFSTEEFASLGPGLQAKVDRFAEADTLANLFRRRSKITLVLLLALIFGTAVSFQVYVLFRKEDMGLTHYWSARVYVTFLAAAVAWYFLAKRLDYRNKYLDYRALAEASRVQIFWQIAGLKDAVADQYLRKQRGVLEWIRDVLRTNQMLDDGPRPSAPTGPGQPTHALVRDRWVKDQESFFRSRVQTDAAWTRRIGRVSNFFLFLGIVFSIARIYFFPNTRVIVELVVIMSVPAIINGYARTMAISEQLNQYRRMEVLFTNARAALDRLERAGDDAKLDQMIGELGREALTENGDWVILHRERPLPTPV